MRLFDALTTSPVEAEVVAALEQRYRGGEADLPELAFPLKLQIQTQSRCQAACVMCPYPVISEELPMGRMEEPLFERIVREAGRHPVERISLFLHNEPLLDKRLTRLVALARRHAPRARQALFTNGELATVERVRALVDAGLDELDLSINGGDAPTFERVNAGLSFERVVGNVDALVAARLRGDLGGLRIKIVALDVEGVPESLDRLERRWPREGAQVFVKPVTNRAGNVAARDSEPGGADAAAQRPRPCQRPFVKAYVVWNGDLILCNCDWRREVVLGNLLEDSLEEIWKGSRAREIRMRHWRGEIPSDSLCGRCDYPRRAAEEDD